MLVLGHLADRIVGIIVDDEPLFRRDIEERQHVTARERSDECFLGIDRFGNRKRQTHAERRRGGRDRDPSVEAPFMRAAVALVGELRVAGPLPCHARPVFVRHDPLPRHSSVLRNSLYCSSLISSSSCSGDDSFRRKNQPLPSASSLIVAGAPSSDWFTATTSPVAGA